MEAYDVSSRESAKALQNTLMDNPKITTALDDLMEQKGIGKTFRIEKLGEHMKSPDPVVSLKALDMGFKLSGDDQEAKRQEPEKYSFFKLPDELMSPAIIEFGDLAKYERIEGQCAICKSDSASSLCKECFKKYPGVTSKLIRYWNGDQCAICVDERRCYDFCLQCAKRVNHAEN